MFYLQEIFFYDMIESNVEATLTFIVANLNLHWGLAISKCTVNETPCL